MRQPVARSGAAVPPVRARPATFFRLSPARPGQPQCFAVRRGEIHERADASYATASVIVSRLYAAPKFPLKPLGQLTTLVQYGISERATEEKVGVPMLRMNNLQADGWDLADLKYIQLGEEDLERYRLHSGDLLFNRTNSKELVGKCEVFREAGDWVFASYLIRVRLSGEVIPEFVSTFLNAPAGRAQIDRVSRHIVGMANVNAEELRELLIPLPNPAEQRRLVQVVEKARAARQRKLAEADALLTSLDGWLLEQLGLTPPAANPRRVFAIRLCQAQASQRLNADYYHPERLEALKVMQTPGPRLRAVRLIALADFIRDPVRADASANYIGLAHVQSNTGELVSSDETAEGQCFAFAKDDVLFARLRPYLNKVHRAERAGICSTEFHVIRLKSAAGRAEAVLPDYLAVILRSSLVLAQTRHMMTGNTHPRLANDDVVNLVVPIPTLAKQEAVAAEVVRRRETARRLRAEAAREWAAAKAWFEEQLLGKPSTEE